MCKTAYDLRRDSYFQMEKLDLVHRMGKGNGKKHGEEMGRNVYKWSNEVPKRAGRSGLGMQVCTR